MVTPPSTNPVRPGLTSELVCLPVPSLFFGKIPLNLQQCSLLEMSLSLCVDLDLRSAYCFQWEYWWRSMKIMACQVGPFHLKLTQINLEMNCIAEHKCTDKSQKLNTRRSGENLNATSHASRASTTYIFALFYVMQEKRCYWTLSSLGVNHRSVALQYTKTQQNKTL